MITPTINAAISGGVCKKPRLTIRVVAPVGGWDEFRSSSTAPVRATDNAPAPIRAGVTFSTRTLGASSRPKAPRENAPAPIATARPIRALRGLEVSARGLSKKRGAPSARGREREAAAWLLRQPALVRQLEVRYLPSLARVATGLGHFLPPGSLLFHPVPTRSGARVLRDAPG